MSFFWAGEYNAAEWGQGIGGECGISGEDGIETVHLVQVDRNIREIQRHKDSVLAVGSGVAENTGVIADAIHPFKALVAVLQRPQSRGLAVQTVQFCDVAQEIDKATDALNAKFGSATIVRGSSIQSKIDVGKKYKAQMELCKRNDDLADLPWRR